MVSGSVVRSVLGVTTRGFGGCVCFVRVERGRLARGLARMGGDSSEACSSSSGRMEWSGACLLAASDTCKCAVQFDGRRLGDEEMFVLQFWEKLVAAVYTACWIEEKSRG